MEDVINVFRRFLDALIVQIQLRVSLVSNFSICFRIYVEIVIVIGHVSHALHKRTATNVINLKDLTSIQSMEHVIANKILLLSTINALSAISQDALHATNPISAFRVHQTITILNREHKEIVYTNKKIVQTTI